MSGRYLSRNETAAQRAHKYNLWIRYEHTWYTPYEFEQRYGHMRNSPAGELELLNPIRELIYGRTLITQMVQSGRPGPVLIDALERLFKFEDKIMANGYEPVANQQDKVAWPTDVPHMTTGPNLSAPRQAG
ncbi:MAG: hypothetical protein EOP49_18335 [Sphingobacteriales bacterium]|nr:MAG: hypothetical protein EOP49_18335 [Sphingobacteriales bacterium]